MPSVFLNLPCGILQICSRAAPLPLLHTVLDQQQSATWNGPFPVWLLSWPHCCAAVLMQQGRFMRPW